MDSVLEGCEIICFEGQKTDLAGCPLSTKEQKMCVGHRQFHAGTREEWRKITKALFVALESLGEEEYNEERDG